MPAKLLYKTDEERAEAERRWRLKYKRTIPGFLNRVYGRMKGRVSGQPSNKNHLYKDKPLMSKEDFLQWASESPEFHSLFEKYKQEGFKRTLAPSVDRVDSDGGYTMGNVRWLTSSENSRLGSISPKRKNNGKTA